MAPVAKTESPQNQEVSQGIGRSGGKWQPLRRQAVMNRNFLAVEPQTSLWEAAGVALVTRLHRVEEVMTRLVAQRCAPHRTDDEVELLHELRVTSRRALAALRLFHELLSENAYRRCRKIVRRVRRRAGALRDLDVFLERLQSVPHTPLADWLRSRINPRRGKAVEDVYRVVLRTMESRKWFRAYRKLHSSWLRAEGSVANVEYGPWAEAQWQKLVSGLSHQVPKIEDDWPAWHRFRIAIKQLRYTAELVAPVVALARDSYGALEHIQEQLGQANDLVLCGNILRDFGPDLPRSLHAAGDELLQRWQHEIANLQIATLDFWKASSLASGCASAGRNPK